MCMEVVPIQNFQVASMVASPFDVVVQDAHNYPVSTYLLRCSTCLPR